ncbi:STAS/SEC14 domain-containing protein [Shewanella sp. FJAT-52076]|uniref:STAS/SEC14 domain-containing protein n=1 Tax=Shewanella sp. FJAT-52076 TaxID=2864202 RepID=UPI001C660792|nr:STAS/SEC14 domain-containing protein [Shewanella sp. FJAT-52076]QYJ73763.1 STAS/SEC14 domain-containing protein [Shewanella sp. FJAT-52076]
MIRLKPGFEHDTIAVEASGMIEAGDYSRVLIPALEQALKDHASVRIWYEIADGCRGASLLSLWQDVLLGLFHLDDFRRIAILTNRPAFRRMGELIGLFMPCPVCVFPLDEVQSAKIWLSQRC